jgi:hypothetical protein
MNEIIFQNASWPKGERGRPSERKGVKKKEDLSLGLHISFSFFQNEKDHHPNVIF